jgi:hypothetical protein
MEYGRFTTENHLILIIIAIFLIHSASLFFPSYHLSSRGKIASIMSNSNVLDPVSRFASHGGRRSKRTDSMRRSSFIDDEQIYVLNQYASQYIRNNVSSSDRVMLVLVGIPGSGKSYYSRRYVQARTTPRRWQVCCQDDMGSRKRVISRVSDILNYTNDSIIIDRCNFDVVQRKHWIDLALDHEQITGRTIHRICLVMPRYNDVEFCAERATSRGVDKSHPTEEDWYVICQRIVSQFVHPSVDEDFSAIFHCKDEEDLELCIRMLNYRH